MATSKLTDAQRVILAGAAARENGLVLPLPTSLGNNRGTHGVILHSLLARELLSERPIAPGEEIWRGTEEHGRTTLVVTDAGLQAIGIETPDGDGDSPANTGETTASVRPTAQSITGTNLPKDNSKLGVLIAALRLPDGATIAELTQATSWQAHSVRGAISGNLKKKLKLTVVSDIVEGRGRVYRISDAEVAQ